MAQPRENFDGIPQRLAENNCRRRSDRDADEGIKRHCCGKTERLAENLVALRARVTREVRNIQRDGGPKSHHTSERRNKEAEKLSEAVELRGIRKHGPEATRLVAHPEKKRQADQEQERSRDALKKANGLDAAQNYNYVQQPKKCETHCRPIRNMRPRRSQGDNHGVDRFAANPRLNAEPSASHERAQNRRNVCAQHAERRTRKHGEGNSVLRTGVRIEQHGNQHQHVAEENGEQRLLPIHSSGDHGAREHVRGNVDAHRNPQSSVVVRAPGAASGRNGREIFVVEPAGANCFCRESSRLEIIHRGIVAPRNQVVAALSPQRSRLCLANKNVGCVLPEDGVERCEAKAGEIDSGKQIFTFAQEDRR